MNQPVESDDPSEQPSPCKPKTSLLGVFKTLVIAIVVVVSLLSFPSVLPWMVAFWLVWASVLLFGDRPGWLPLVTCVVILVVKLVPRTPAMIVLGCVMLLVVAIRIRYRHHRLHDRRFAGFCVAALWGCWGWMFYEFHAIANSSRTLVLDPARPVVCLGDSLTQGMIPDRGYPGALEAMIRVPVVNRGFSGIATSQGLGQMDRVLADHPQVVVIELGGHDFLKGHSRAATKANLLKMIQTCRDHDAEVILMEIPRGFIFDPFASLEREIAYEQDVQLVADTWLRQIVVMSPVAPPGMWMPKSQLSDDGIHSNPAGSKAIAVRVAEALQKMVGDDIRVKPTPKNR